MTIESFINEMQFWENSHIFGSLIYVFIGFKVVDYINKTGDSINNLLSEAGIGWKGRSMANSFLILTWPAWVIIALQTYLRNRGVEE